MTKTKEQIRDEEAEKYANELFPPIHPAWSGSENQACQSGFEAGFDCRDKIGNEALKVAVEALEFYANRDNYDREGVCEHNGSSTNYEGDWWIDYGFHARVALAKIRELRGEK